MYVVVEGPDGAGKTTICSALRVRFEALDVVSMREQPDTTIGKLARQYFIEGGHGRQGVDPYVAALLMVAARIDLHRSIDWDDGRLRICDRSFVTTYTHQREVPIEVLDRLHGFDRDPLIRLPDLAIYLRVTPDTAVSRASARGREHLSDGELRALCLRYDELFMSGTWARTPALVGRSVVIQADGPLEEVVDACVLAVADAMSDRVHSFIRRGLESHVSDPKRS